MLSDQKLALLNSKLYVPIVVRDILGDTATAQDDVHYALHEVISDFQPDAALLCIALAAKYIANTKGQNEVSLNIMALECDRIIEDYGYLWLQHAEQKNIDNEILFDTLVHVPEDLESLSELLSINAELLSDSNKTASEILNILKIQADAQTIVAEHYIEVFDAQGAEKSDTEETAMPVEAMTTNNIIAFPTANIRAS